MISIKTALPFLQRLKITFRALRHRNYRLFFSGQTVSLIGTWMQQVAIGWLVYRLTNSALLLGIVGFASQIPIFLLSPIAGVIADRWNRHHLLITTQVLAMVQAFLLSAAVLTKNVTVWHIILLGVFLGMINAFDAPIRQSFVVDLVANKEDLGNAIALNSLMVNGTRMIGPALAGVLIAAVGEGFCFLLNGLSYFFVIGALLAMKVNITKKEKPATQVLQRLKEGFVYAFGFVPIRYILLLLAFSSLLGFPYIVLMPVFAKDLLHGGPNTLGFLMSSSGIGALIGALYLASRKTVYGLGRLIAKAVTVLGLALIAFSFSRILLLSSAMLLLVGFGMMTQIAASNTILQTIVPDDKRGRLMSFYAVAFMGMTPFGSLLIGSVAHRIGAPYAVMIGGLCCLCMAFLFHRKLPDMRKLVYPIYTTMGIIPSPSLKK